MAITENSEKPPAMVTIEDFSALVAGMSRILSGLGRLQPFIDADMGLGEWVAVTTLAEKDGINNKMLARTLGVSGQRVNQICQSLSSGGLIKVNQSAEDNRSNEITITEAGRAKLNAVNLQLLPLLADALKGKERSVAVAARQLKQVMRVLRVKDGEARKLDTKEKEAKRAAREAKLADREKRRATKVDKQANRAAKKAAQT